MASLMIAKNEEILAKQITAKPENTTNDMTSLIEQLSASNAKLAKEVQAAITVNELVKANADLVKNVREVLQNSNTLNNTDSISDYVKDAVPEIHIAPATPVTQEVPEAPVVPESPMVADIELPTEAIEQEPDEFDFESFEIPDETSDSVGTNFNDVPIASDEDIIDDINISALNEMIDFEGSVIADELSSDLDEQMSDSLPSENINNIDDIDINTLDDNPNKQLTEEEIAALFANL